MVLRFHYPKTLFRVESSSQVFFLVLVGSPTPQNMCLLSERFHRFGGRRSESHDKELNSAFGIRLTQPRVEESPLGGSVSHVEVAF